MDRASRTQRLAKCGVNPWWLVASWPAEMLGGMAHQKTSPKKEGGRAIQLHFRRLLAFFYHFAAQGIIATGAVLTQLARYMHIYLHTHGQWIMVSGISAVGISGCDVHGRETSLGCDLVFHCRSSMSFSFHWIWLTHLNHLLGPLNVPKLLSWLLIEFEAITFPIWIYFAWLHAQAFQADVLSWLSSSSWHQTDRICGFQSRKQLARSCQGKSKDPEGRQQPAWCSRGAGPQEKWNVFHCEQIKTESVCTQHLDTVLYCVWMSNFLTDGDCQMHTLKFYTSVCQHTQPQYLYNEIKMTIYHEFASC